VSILENSREVVAVFNFLSNQAETTARTGEDRGAFRGDRGVSQQMVHVKTVS